MFTKYESGAEVEIEEVYRYADGAEVEADAVYAVKNGAEEEVWFSKWEMVETSNSLTNGTLSVLANGGLSYNKFMRQDGDSYIGSISGDGSIKFVAEGNWTNPTVTFDWQGGFIYWTTDYANSIRRKAGEISLVYTLANGSSYAPYITVGTNASDTGGMSPNMDSFERTIEGEVVSIGVLISVESYTSNYLEANLEISIDNFSIDGKYVKFPLDSEFDKQIW